jgi:hypothetical protein
MPASQRIESAKEPKHMVWPGFKEAMGVNEGAFCLP